MAAEHHEAPCPPQLGQQPPSAVATTKGAMTAATPWEAVRGAAGRMEALAPRRQHAGGTISDYLEAVASMPRPRGREKPS